LFDDEKNLKSRNTNLIIEWKINFKNYKLVATNMGYWAKDVCGSSYLFGNTLVEFGRKDIMNKLIKL
jgi:hypothetical protein